MKNFKTLVITSLLVLILSACGAATTTPSEEPTKYVRLTYAFTLNSNGGNDVQIFAEWTTDTNPRSDGANGALLTSQEVAALSSPTPYQGLTFYLVNEDNTLSSSATTDAGGHAYLSTNFIGYPSLSSSWSCSQIGHWPVNDASGQIIGGGEAFLCLPPPQPLALSLSRLD